MSSNKSPKVGIEKTLPRIHPALDVSPKAARDQAGNYIAEAPFANVGAVALPSRDCARAFASDFNGKYAKSKLGAYVNPKPVLANGSKLYFVDIKAVTYLDRDGKPLKTTLESMAFAIMGVKTDKAPAIPAKKSKTSKKKK